jgi:hypothetical protein
MGGEHCLSDGLEAGGFVGADMRTLESSILEGRRFNSTSKYQ